MDLEKGFEVPRQYIWDPEARVSGKPTFARAANGVPAGRVRSDVAKKVVNSTFALLPSTGVFSRETVAATMLKRVYVLNAGTNATLGRLHLAYPRRGARIAKPITHLEARRALQNCGLDMGRLIDVPGALRPFPLLAKADGVGLTVNPHADNGLPVMGKWDSGGGEAAQMVMGLALSVRKELERHVAGGGTVAEWKRDAELKRPWLVALLGKAKADYYAPEKVTHARLRFYNVLPRQIMLIMQQATQPLERNAAHINQGVGHSGQGITLVRGGAALLVSKLQQQLDAEGSAYVRGGRLLGDHEAAWG
jgi:hypothetical protein